MSKLLVVSNGKLSSLLQLRTCYCSAVVLPFYGGQLHCATSSSIIKVATGMLAIRSCEKNDFEQTVKPREHSCLVMCGTSVLIVLYKQDKCSQGGY